MSAEFPDVPDWQLEIIQSYREHLNNTGGNDPRDLLQRLATDGRLASTNVVAYTLACMISAQVRLLHTLDEAGELRRGRLPAHPEVHVMWAEEDITYEEVWPGSYVVEHEVLAGDVYLVCPVCGCGGEFVRFSDGTEYAGLSALGLVEAVEGDDVVVMANERGYDFTSDGDHGLSHQSYGCYARLDVPAWFDVC